MEEDSIPREGCPAGSIGSISFLCKTQSIQVTRKTSYNSDLQKVYDFCNPTALLPNTPNRTLKFE